MNFSRRSFITKAGILAAGLQLPSLFADQARPRRILLSNCWHNVNIGDIAHAPAFVHLVETYLPDVGVTIWPFQELTAEVKNLLTQAFPKLTILEHGGLTDGKATREDLVAAMKQADLFVVGSGGFHANPARAWMATVGDKPWGAYGVSVDEIDNVPELSKAAFFYLRDTVSLGVVQQAGLKAPVVEFGPDSVFSFNLRDDVKADAFLQKAGLEAEKFLCVIPRLRYSPYHQIYHREPTAVDLEHDKVNENFKKSDHQMLRVLITNWVNDTGMKVLACPEMTYGVALAREQLIDPLPKEIQERIAWRDSFWMPDEAASVFARARAVVSFDCHSPIIALANGTPAVHLRLPTDTRKSQMFTDIGLGEWVHNTSDIEGVRLTRLVIKIHDEYSDAKEKVAASMKYVQRIQRRTMETLARALA